MLRLLLCSSRSVIYYDYYDYYHYYYYYSYYYYYYYYHYYYTTVILRWKCVRRNST